MKKFLLALLVVLPVLFYGSSLFPKEKSFALYYSFAQDDFIHLNASKASNILEFLNFFNPFYQFPDIFFYRPLPTQVHFFINSQIFGLNPLPFHVESLIFHLLNTWLFYLIVKKLWKDRTIAFISTLFYGVSAAHFLSLFYISAFQQVARTFYLLLSIFLWIKFFEVRKTILYILGLVSFIAALLSKESSIVLPPFLLLVDFLLEGRNVLKERIKYLLPYFAIAGIYLLIRLSGFQTIFGKGEYDVSFSLFNILQNLKWYILWSFGLPEILSTYPSLGLNSLIQFTRDFSSGGVIILFFGVFIFLVISSVARNLKMNLKISQLTFRDYRNRAFLYSILIFFISLIPVLFLREHKYPQYLDLAFLGVLPIFAWIILNAKWKVLGYTIILVFIALQYFSIQLSEQTHWTTKRSVVADYYQKSFKEKYPNIAENSRIFLVGSSEQAREVSHALAGKYAFLVWYPGKISEVKYLEEKDLPKDRNNVIIEYLSKY